MRVGASGLPYCLGMAILRSSGLRRQRETAYSGWGSSSKPWAVALGDLDANLSFPVTRAFRCVS